MTPVPVVDAQGTHRAIGLAIGRAVPDRIAGMARNYQLLFEHSPQLKLTWPQAALQARQYLPFIESAVPQYLAELQGLAEGSGVPFDDLLICNCFEELTGDLLFEKCTSVAFAPEHTQDQHTLLGHTEDWLPIDRAWQYVVRVRPDDEAPFIAAVYGGLLANVGLNGAGVAQCINSMYPTDARPGLPRVFVGRHVLTAPRLGVAIERALHPRRAAGYNHVLADEHGELYNLETTARQFDLLYGRPGYVAHANNYLSDRLRDLEDQPDQLVGSHVRANRADHLARQLMPRGAVTRADVQRILSDHVNHPYSICSHAEDVPLLEQSVTISAYLLDVHARTLWYCYGNPCQGEFAPIPLEA